MPYGDSLNLTSWQRATTFSSSNRSQIIDIGAGDVVGIATTTDNFVATSFTFEVAQGSTYTFYTVVSSSGGSIAVNNSTQLAQYYALTPIYFQGAVVMRVIANSSVAAENGKPFTLVTKLFAN